MARNLFVKLLCFVLAGIPAFTSGQPVNQHGNLHVQGTQLVDEQGSPIILRGVSYGWHNWWPRFYNAESVAWLASDWQCSVVRAAMGVEPEGGYMKNPEMALASMKAVIDGAIASGIYVIIDFHSHGIQTETAKKFFTDMARTYGHYPNIIYEIFNEPVKDPWETIRAYSVEVIRTIREIDPDNIILVGNPHWDQDVHLAADNPVTGFSNLMYTLHFYAATHGQWLRDRGEYALSKGLPLFVSECAGMEASGNGNINDTEWKAWTDWMENRGISWVCWAVTDKDETCSMLKPQAAASGKWTASDLKESGTRTRQLIIEKQSRP